MRRIQPHPIPVQRFDHTPVGWRFTVSVHCGRDRDEDTQASICGRAITALEDVLHTMREALAVLESKQPGGDV